LSPFAFIHEIIRFVFWSRKNHIKIVHVYHRRLAVILNLLEFIGDYKTVYTAQLSYTFSPYFWSFSPKISIAVSQSVRDNLLRTTRSRYISVIGNPTKFPSRYHEVLIDEKIRSRAICIARLEPVKGHEYLIEAWKILIDNGHDFELLLVGEGSLLKNLRDKVKELGLSRFVKFLGFRDDVTNEIQTCLFAILVSSVEGLPLVVIEAAAQGRSTLLNDVDGSRDCLIPGQKLPNGLMYGHVKNLSQALLSWFQHPSDVWMTVIILLHILRIITQLNQWQRNISIYIKI
jgi:glycosyltransferase involved in cell wall biosynthesis